MSYIESLWTYIAVPAAIIGALIYTNIRLRKIEKLITNTPHPPRKTQTARPYVSTQEASDNEKPAGCTHELGYLYKRKGLESSHIPTECYGCQKLLRCLYSPSIIEKVYGT